MDPTPLVVSLHAHHDAFDDDHPAFRAQVAQLEQELVREVDEAEVVQHPVARHQGRRRRAGRGPRPGRRPHHDRGDGAGWLHRDRTRSLEIEWTEGDETHRVTVRGDAIDTATLRPVAEAAAARIGEGAWARSATAPS